MSMVSLRPLLVPAGVVIVLVGLILHSTNVMVIVYYMIVARSVAFDRDLDLTNDYADPAHILRPEHRHALPGKDGKLRPLHDVGLPVGSHPYSGVAYPSPSGPTHGRSRCAND